ncbi:hypothetical protein Dimus_012975, partial [Dionaea muscipula]
MAASSRRRGHEEALRPAARHAARRATHGQARRGQPSRRQWCAYERLHLVWARPEHAPVFPMASNNVLHGKLLPSAANDLYGQPSASAS